MIDREFQVSRAKMPSATITPESAGFNVTSLEKEPQSKTNYGAVVTGLDLNDVTGNDFGTRPSINAAPV